MEVHRIYNRLSLSGKVLSRDFTFDIVNEQGSFSNHARIRIQQDYALANQITPAVGDAIKVETAVNNGDYMIEFDGIIAQISLSGNYIMANCEDNTAIKETIKETFEDAENQDIADKLFESSDLDLTDYTWKKFIADGIKRDVAHEFVETLENVNGVSIFHYFADGKTILTESLSGENYNIDEYVIDVGFGRFNIFPIPELKLCDSLTFRDVEYSIRKISRQNGLYCVEVSA